MKIYPPSTLTDICKELNITTGQGKNLNFFSTEERKTWTSWMTWG